MKEDVFRAHAGLVSGHEESHLRMLRRMPNLDAILRDQRGSVERFHRRLFAIGCQIPGFYDLSRVLQGDLNITGTLLNLLALLLERSEGCRVHLLSRLPMGTWPVVPLNRHSIESRPSLPVMISDDRHCALGSRDAKGKGRVQIRRTRSAGLDYDGRMDARHVLDCIEIMAFEFAAMNRGLAQGRIHHVGQAHIHAVHRRAIDNLRYLKFRGRLLGQKCPVRLILRFRLPIEGDRRCLCNYLAETDLPAGRDMSQDAVACLNLGWGYTPFMASGRLQALTGAGGDLQIGRHASGTCRAPAEIAENTADLGIDTALLEVAIRRCLFDLDFIPRRAELLHNK